MRSIQSVVVGEITRSPNISNDKQHLQSIIRNIFKVVSVKLRLDITSVRLNSEGWTFCWYVHESRSWWTAQFHWHFVRKI